MSIDSPLNAATAKLIEALQTASPTVIHDIAALAAKGYFIDGISGLIISILFLVLSVFCFIKAVSPNCEEMRLLCGVGSVILLVLSAVSFQCGFQGVFAPDTVIVTELISAIKR